MEQSDLRIGDRVTHPSRPGEVATVNRIVYPFDSRPWYRVTWPNGVGSNGLFIRRELHKVGE